MLAKISDLREREIINIIDGRRLGPIKDIDVDLKLVNYSNNFTRTRQTFGRGRLFCTLGKYYKNWCGCNFSRNSGIY